jgi:hypothetical protein
MATSVSFHRPDFTRTSVSRLSSGTWTVQLYDNERNNITIFTGSSELLTEFAKTLINLTELEMLQHKE